MRHPVNWHVVAQDRTTWKSTMLIDVPTVCSTFVPNTSVQFVLIGFTCPAITVATVILWALDRVRGRALGWLDPGTPKSQPHQYISSAVVPKTTAHAIRAWQPTQQQHTRIFSVRSTKYPLTLSAHSVGRTMLLFGVLRYRRTFDHPEGFPEPETTDPSGQFTFRFRHPNTKNVQPAPIA